jgi:hypothetical protein
MALMLYNHHAGITENPDLNSLRGRDDCKLGTEKLLFLSKIKLLETKTRRLM